MPYETHKHYDFDFDSECVIEDFCTIMDILGFRLFSRHGKGPSAGVHYSGFWSQGDGASFEGTYRYKPGCVAALKAHAPTDKVLHGIAARLVAAQRKCFYAATARISQRGNYSHEYTMSLEMGYDEFGDREREFYHPDAEGEILEACRDLARWLYKQLEEAYEYGASYAMGQYVANKENTVKEVRKELLTVLRDYRPIRKAGLNGNSLCGVIQSNINGMIARIEKLREDIRVTLRDNRIDDAYNNGYRDQIGEAAY